jgi:hypothetical protein
MPPVLGGSEMVMVSVRIRFPQTPPVVVSVTVSVPVRFAE